ncbi:chaperonin 10-like protein [Tricladium varicosporioides]|nr:chaperonin 10-like protein [Hymenoscyphus varicosporioides]
MSIEFTVFKGSTDGEILESKTTLPLPSGNEVLLKHTHSGVCGTDAHYSTINMVLGHEGVGIVEAVGDEVKGLSKGDRIGFGWVKDGCGKCEYCLQGYQYHCTEGERGFGDKDLNQGSWASHSIWPATRLVKIPHNILSEHAGPFMCAGQTVFMPFYRNKIKPSSRVGIVGIGGLGHLAIQFSAAWGCETVVFSTSDNKRQEALGFGATEFYNTKTMKASEVKKLDHLIVTSSIPPDWKLYVELLKPFAHIYPLTVSFGTLDFPFISLITKELTIQGSCSSSAKEVEEMLKFIVAHGIKPMIEKFPFSLEGIKSALDKLEKGQVRYRGVVEM